MADQKNSRNKVAQTFLSGQSQPLSSPDTSRMLEVTQRKLPHWTVGGSIYWINFHLADAFPQAQLREWRAQRADWLNIHPPPWSESAWEEYDRLFGARLDRWLDAGTGSRMLASPELRACVINALLKFDSLRLKLHAAVIMPTHVHAVIEVFAEQSLDKLLKGIKGSSARAINKIRNESGTVWMDESYDHIVRSEVQFRHYIRYTRDNPLKAGLSPDEYWLHDATAG